MASQATFTVTVERMDRPAGTPLAGAEVIFRWIPPGQGNSTAITAITNADGEATLPDVDTDGHSYRLKVSKGNSFAHAEMNAKVVEKPGAIVYLFPRKVMVDFVGPVEIGVTVELAKHAGDIDLALAGVKVTATGVGYNEECLTNAEGNAAFALPVGVYDLKFEKVGFETFGCEAEVRTDLRDHDPTAAQIVPNYVVMKPRPA